MSMLEGETKESEREIDHLPEWVRTLDLDAAANRNMWPPRGAHEEFDWEQPTYKVYHDPNYDNFSPNFSSARGKLDYTYHLNPARTRQRLQDGILNRVVEGQASSCGATKYRRPWIVFSAGPMGVGKGYVLSELNDKGLFPLDDFLKIDPDMLKSELPEIAGYLRLDPSSAATKLHRESTQMADILLEYALEARVPTLVDGSLRDVVFYKTLLERIRKEFPEYRMAILHVTASAETIRSRAQSRAKKTGRAIPTELLEESIAQAPKSVKALSPSVDVTFTIRNEDNQPIQLAEGATSWKEFRKMWWKNLDRKECDLAPWCESFRPCISQMAKCVLDKKCQKAACKVWSKAYPSFCPGCTLASDGQCGICIHDVHLCKCTECGPATGSVCSLKLALLGKK